MSDEKDRKPGPTANGPKAANKKSTFIGVPALPAARPSDLELTRELPHKAKVPAEQPSVTLVGSTKPAPESPESNTGIDVKAMSGAEAERVLGAAGKEEESAPSSGTPKAPGVAGALPKPSQRRAPLKTPPLGSDTFKGLPRPNPGLARPVTPGKTTRPGVAPQPGTSPRPTLLLDSSLPTSGDRRDTTERPPPIVVPGSGSMRPKAVTQAPPWGEGEVRMAPGIRTTPQPPSAHNQDAEELSASLLLPSDSTGELPFAEELSGSLLIEDVPSSPAPIIVNAPRPPAGKASPVAPPGKPPSVPPAAKGSSSVPPPSKGSSVASPAKGASAPAGRAASVKPTVPNPSVRSASGRQQTLPAGMPELPTMTPAPKIEFAPAEPAELVAPVAPIAPAAPADIPVPAPAPEPEFPDASWPPPAAAATTTATATATATAPGVAAGPGKAPGPASVPPPPEAISGDIELTQLPRGGLASLIAKLGRQLRKLDPALKTLEPPLQKLLAKMPGGSALSSGSRPKWVLAITGLVIVIGMVGLIASLVHGEGASEQDTSASAHPSSLPSSAPAPTSASPTPAPSVALAPCTVSGAPHVVAPSAIVAAGVEVVRVRDGVAVGFAPTDRDAMAVRLDVTSLSATATVKARSTDPVRRVTPLPGPKGALALAVDADNKNDRVQGRRTVLTDPPMQLGTSDGALVSTHPGGPAAGKLWPLDSGDNADALRGAVDSEGDHPVAIAFRRGGTVWMGTGAANLQASKGDLSHVDGLGTAVGSPAVAMNGGIALVAWSDRPSASEPWHLRWLRFAAGEPASAPQNFAPPAGGKGSQTMSPNLTALPGGRFLLVWTEGPAEGHDVRALTLGPDGEPIGGPLVISNPGVNAGQGQAAVTAAGQGVVVFLESAASAFQVVATPIACGP